MECMKETSTIRSCCVGHVCYRMQGSPLQRSMCDDPVLVLCILTCSQNIICNRQYQLLLQIYFRAYARSDFLNFRLVG